MNLVVMHQTAHKISSVMKVLSNECRLMILCHLLNGERSVGELVELLGMRQAAISQQLALLRKDRMVRTRRDGQMIYYSLEREDVRRMLGFLYDTYCHRVMVRSDV